MPKGTSTTKIADVHAFVDRSLQAQAKLWPLTLKGTQDPFPAPLKGFVAGAVNDVLDAHLYRMATLSVPLASFMQLVVYLSIMVSLFGFRKNGIEPLPSQTNFVYADIGRDATAFQKRMADRNIQIRGTYQDFTNYSRVSMGKLEDLEVFDRVFTEVFQS